ncbi:hypothetical protein SLS56_005947 [Neofusicoccum ribis]|uniref:Uncharacterized protein n=1 Tax=Neofusicoccum ribis TaxID=45134 RepID=A0ABR3SS01_9PEZI
MLAQRSLGASKQNFEIDYDPLAPTIRRRLSTSPKYEPKPLPVSSIPSGPRIRGRKGKKLRETSAPLQRSYLGVGSEVLILRDVIEPETNEEVEDNDPADDTDAAKRRREIREALEASIAKQQAVSNQEEVNEQINKLRPVSPDGPFYPAFVTRQDSKALRKALRDGYNVAQLRRYASVEEGFQQLRELKREEKAEGGLLWKSAWQEGTSPMEQRLPEAATTVVPVEKMTKVNLVDRIVRDIWDVNVIEDNEALGEIEVKLEPWQLDLLMPDGRQNYSILDNIGYHRNVRIESYRPERIIRFIAARENAEQAAMDLERSLRGAASLDVDLSVFESIRQRREKSRLLDLLSQEDIDVATRLSRTVIETSSESKLIIHGLNKDSVELARRILFSVIDIPLFCETKVMTDTEGEGFLQSCASESTLHYRDRRKGYGRWTFPVARSNPKVNEEHSTSVEVQVEQHPQEAVEHPEEEVEHLAKDDATATTEAPADALSGESQDTENNPRIAEEIATYLNAPVDGPSGPPEGSYPATKNVRKTYWGPQTLVELFASYGNVLHKPPPAKTSLSPMPLSDLLEHPDTPHRVFHDTIPGFSPFLQHIATSAKLHRSPTHAKAPDALLFRFSPSPWDIEDTSALEDFPDLGLRMEINSTTGFSRFQGFGLTVRERHVDVLLPKQPVDLQFVRREVLWTRDALTRSDEIPLYLASITTNLSGSGNIRAPPTLKLRIPTWTVRNSERYSSLPTERTEHGEEFVKEFVFSAVEHRQMFKYDLSDGKHRVSYTSVEGGRVGGRRGELRTRLRKPVTDQESLQAQAPGLIKTAFKVASLIDDAVHDRLDPPELIIKKVEHHASFKRLTSTGEFEEPLTINTLKEVEDKGALSNTAQEVGGKKRKGGRAKKRATDQGDENDDLALQEGAN